MCIGADTSEAIGNSLETKPLLFKNSGRVHLFARDKPFNLNAKAAFPSKITKIILILPLTSKKEIKD